MERSESIHQVRQSEISDRKNIFNIGKEREDWYRKKERKGSPFKALRKYEEN